MDRPCTACILARQIHHTPNPISLSDNRPTKYVSAPCHLHLRPYDVPRLSHQRARTATANAAAAPCFCTGSDTFTDGAPAFATRRTGDKGGGSRRCGAESGCGRTTARRVRGVGGGNGLGGSPCPLDVLGLRHRLCSCNSVWRAVRRWRWAGRPADAQGSAVGLGLRTRIASSALWARWRYGAAPGARRRQAMTQALELLGRKYTKSSNQARPLPTKVDFGTCGGVSDGVRTGIGGYSTEFG